MQESNLLMYTTEDGLTKIEATFVNDTVWLSVEQMAELFQRDRSVIGKHIRNIFKDTVTLENGEELPLSRHRSKELRQQFLSYMKENI